jgi:hypothetical protein
MDTGFSRVEGLDARRERVDSNSRVTPDDHYLMVVSLRPGLPDGLYTVAWLNLSEADGHTLSGAYPLIVGAFSEGVAVPAAATTEPRLFVPEAAASRLWLFAAGGTLVGLLWRGDSSSSRCFVINAGLVARRRLAERARSGSRSQSRCSLAPCVQPSPKQRLRLTCRSGLPSGSRRATF